MAFLTGWQVYATVSPQVDGWLSVSGVAFGESAEDALAGAKAVLDTMAEGKEAYIRHAPSVETVRDPLTDKERHKGFVRFTFRNVAGEHRRTIRYEDSIVEFTNTERAV